jgi:hypothetical protein
MKRSVGIALLIAAGTVSACSQGKPNTDTTPIGFMGTRWTATLTAQPGSPMPQVTGAASVMGVGDSSKSKIQVSINNATPNAQLPWHLHRGSCGNDQGIVGDPNAYQPLQVGSDGQATGSAVIGVATPRSGEYMINVHASTADLATIVACGNLTGPSSR